ncbi:Ger(x)C family spore germination protein [Sporosarcina sp. FSL K6-1508]|uniref:Ger(x)C family spore germination protein n=1 Tax=Sporosarcina sp. FSL K6-1508 TaxID=2921553 RepID=UPI0030F925B5
MTRLRKGRLVFIAVIFVLSIILQTGCAFKDIDKRLFVIGIGIDPSEKEEGHYKITLKISIPIGSINETTGPTYTYLSHEGETLAESIRILETHVDKVLEFGHAKIIVINEKLLGEEIGHFMDYFVRRADIQLIAWVAAARPSAEEILKVEPSTEYAASSALFDFFDSTGTENPYIRSLFLFEFRRNYLAKGINVVVPLIETNKDQQELIINKSLVLKENKKPLELTSVQTKQFNSNYFNMSGFSYKVESEGYLMLLNIQSISMKYKIITEKGHPRIDMKVKLSGVVGESNKNLSLAKLDDYNKIASEEMKRKLMDLLMTLQKNEVDPFGFGLRYRATRLHEKNMMDKWESLYPEIDFNISMSVELKSTGAIE